MNTGCIEYRFLDPWSVINQQNSIFMAVNQLIRQPAYSAGTQIPMAFHCTWADVIVLPSPVPCSLPGAAVKCNL